MGVASILWRRLDTPGHDACRLDRRAAGWRLEGTAVFRHEGVPARLAYYVVCDLAWRTRQGYVQGWLGADSIEWSAARTNAGVWTLNGAIVPNLENCLDLDFGFTPATNLLQIRRLALDEGQVADAPAAWLNVPAGPAGTLELLPQRYERRSEAAYWLSRLPEDRVASKEFCFGPIGLTAEDFLRENLVVQLGIAAGPPNKGCLLRCSSRMTGDCHVRFRG
jgi:hypothetical protein